MDFRTAITYGANSRHRNRGKGAEIRDPNISHFQSWGGLHGERVRKICVTLAERRKISGGRAGRDRTNDRFSLPRVLWRDLRGGRRFSSGYMTQWPLYVFEGKSIIIFLGRETERALEARHFVRRT